MDQVYIVGAGMVRFGRWPELSVKALAAQALAALWADAPVGQDRIDAVWFANSGWGMEPVPLPELGGVEVAQHCIRGEVAILGAGIQGVPTYNVENACASGSNAVHGAWMSIKAGLYDVVLALGVEKLYFPEARERMFAGFMAGTDVEVTAKLISAMRAMAKKKAEDEAAKGSQAPAGEKQRSAFMDIYATGARAHMKKYGSTQRQLAMIAAKNHVHGSLNPLAQYQNAMTVDEVLADAAVAYPLTRAMCAPIGDGAAAVLLCSERVKEKLGSAARPVRIEASVIQSGRTLRPDGLGIGARLAKRAYEMAGVGPDEINVAEVHDATAYGEMAQSEELGFAKEGEGGALAESGATKVGGRLPINPSGGLECRGHPIGATGVAQVVELVTQLRGEAGPRQVEGVRLALAENGGGFIGTEEAAMTIHILSQTS